MSTGSTLQYCYIDLSTATSAGKTSIRIFPSVGRDKFFTDVIRDVDSKKGVIEEIIKEAIEESDRIRIIISREDSFDSKSIRKYVEFNYPLEEIYEEIMKSVKSLASEIKFYNAMDNTDIIREVIEFRSGKKNPNLREFGEYLSKKEFAKSKYNGGFHRLELNLNGKHYLLTLEKWDDVAWEKMDRNSSDYIYPIWFNEIHRTLMIDAGCDQPNHLSINGELQIPSHESDDKSMHGDNGPIQHANELAKNGYFELKDDSESLFSLTSKGINLYETMKKNNFPIPVHE